MSNVYIAKGRKNSVSKNYKVLIDNINTMYQEYCKIWNSSEENRKELNQIIDDSLNYIKESFIELYKRAKNCNKKQLIDLLINISDSISFNTRDDLKVKEYLLSNAKKIENRFNLDKVFDQRLSEIEEKFSMFPVPTKDYSDEEVINVKKRRSIKEQVNSLSDYKDDLESLVKGNFNQNDNDYRTITMNGRSLVKFVEYFYGDDTLWESIYNYEDNSKMIDYTCFHYHKELNEVINDSNILDGIEIKFPLELKVYYKSTK